LEGRWPRRDISREWLVTNGLGGYASGTVDGVFSRRYHGLLIAALPAGRTMMLTGLSERLRLPDRSVVYLGAEELSGVGSESIIPVTEFRLEKGLPIWIWEHPDFNIEKRLVLPYRQNSVHVIYRLLAASGPIRLGLRPAVHFRPHDDPVSAPLQANYRVTFECNYAEISVGGTEPVLRMQVHGPHAAFTVDPKIVREILYPIEESRGYESAGNTWSPGYYRVDLAPGESACLVGSTELWPAVEAMDSCKAIETEIRRRESLIQAAPSNVCTDFALDLVLASDQFLIIPASRQRDKALARAEGEEAWTVIAGYHWFTDWGRDTMISLEGLTLCTGRFKEARWILRTFANYIRDGLIPNLFPEGENEGLFHTADATLWFFHALQRYVAATSDRDTLRLILPKLMDVVEHHVRGTRFGIHVDSKDGLLSQGEAGYQLTWMDAKVGDWVVTPRRGKAVEINGLWHNALCLLAQWLDEEGDSRSSEYWERAARVRDSFNRRFWCPERNHLFDIVDGENADDPACRPNQLLAFSLDHPVLAREYWMPVLDTVEKKLLTPVGLRSLDPDHPDYKSLYFGDLRARDAAYHQGTVWAWLIGPFVDAWLKVHPGDYGKAHSFVQGFGQHLDEACVGSISEIFDGDRPFRPRGCVAQAWSVAEVLRCWAKTEQPGQASRSETEPAHLETLSPTKSSY
jgi:predicted glycogen debranching enzyme